MHIACKQSTNIVNNDLHLSLYLFLIFPDFLSIFTVITILGNAHRPCKLHLNIINKYTSCLSIFSWPLFYFLLIWLYLQELPYWEMCTDHINNASTLSKRVYNMSILCLLILFDLLMIFASVTILGNAHRPWKQ